MKFNLCQMELKTASISFHMLMHAEILSTFVISRLRNPTTDDSGAVSPDQDDKQDGEKTETHKKSVNKATKPKHETKGHSSCQQIFFKHLF